MSWTDDQIEAVWAKAIKSSNSNEEQGYRKDQCTAWIKKNEYGNRNSKYGWEIDHGRIMHQGKMIDYQKRYIVMETKILMLQQVKS